MTIKNIIIILVCCFWISACANQKPDLSLTEFKVREDGTILKDGQPYFPLGFYLDRADVSTYIKNIEAIPADGGFNIVNLPYTREDQQWTEFLDQCAKKGIYVVSQMYYDEQFLGQVKKYKDHPAIYGWSIADDADNGHFSLEQLQARHDQTKAEDPGHVTETSLTGYYKKRRLVSDSFMQIADVGGYQCYPITPLPDYDVTAENALTEAYLRIAYYVNSASKFGKPLVLNSQTFPWTDNDPELDARFPSALEIRNMIYGGLAAGIKGLITYTYNDLVEQEAQWAEFQAIAKDINMLQPALLDGKLNRLQTGDEELVISTWESENGNYVAVINTSYTQEKELAHAILPGAKSLKPINERLDNTLELVDGKLVGSLPALSVQLFEVKK